MRRIFCLLLALVMLSGVATALADGPVMWPHGYPPCITIKDLTATLDMDEVIYELQNQPDYQETITYAATKLVLQTKLPNGYANQIDVSVVLVEENKTLFEKSYTNRSGETFKTSEISIPYNRDDPVHIRVGMNIDGWYREIVLNRRLVFLNNNTACAYGIRFRDLDASFVSEPITSKWYMFTPIDLYALSQNGGTRTLTMCASNMYPVGIVQITRHGDSVYVNAYADDGVTLRHPRACFFHSLHEVDAAALENGAMRQTGFSMGTAISLLNNLGGNGQVLFYFSGIVDYDPNGLERFSYNYNKTPEILKMKELLQQIEATGGLGNG